MKKAMFISGTLTILLLALLLTGWASADDTIKEAMRQGNRHFESADYSKALAAYETGLAAGSENKPLNFNAAQAAYLLGDYEKAVKYFEKSEDAVEKFLSVGNICYRAGDAVQDINQKAQLYAQALQFYKEGIIKYPQDLLLKYNYEFVKGKLDELLENMEQENSEQGEDGDNQDSQEQESSNGENSQGEQEQESDNSESSQGSQEQNSEQDEETGDNQNQSQDGDGEQEEGYSQEEGENAIDQEAVDRILQMLENQEEESLKNNQEVVDGNGEKNGW